MSKRLTKEEFRKRLYQAHKNDIEAFDEFVGVTKYMRFQCKLGHIWSAITDEVLRGYGCPYCSNRRVLVGFNDLWTTRPDVAKMLKNPEDGYKYTSGSTKKLLFICPDCGKEKVKSIAGVCRQGLCCDYCGDGISFPEKFGRAFLEQLPIDNHICEYNPEWARPYFYDDYFTYDYVEYIIEWDGAFHYLERSNTRQSLAERQAIDLLKNDLAIRHDINIFRIDCLVSDSNYIRQNILNSELIKIFDLSHIDWDLCNLKAQSNLVKEACASYTSGQTNLKNIAKEMHLHEDTIRSYLKKGHNLGWCDYDPIRARQQMYDSKSKEVAWIDDTGSIICKFKNSKICEKQMKEKYNISVNHNSIKWACQTHKPYKGFNFRYANETIQN